MVNSSIRKLTKEKANGRYYTPDYIVNNILDLSGYYGNTILNKHVIDNSCGDGAFLTKIVERFCYEGKKENISVKDLNKLLSMYIHGIELDKTECDKCIRNLNNIVKEYNIENVKWDVRCGDTLHIDEYDGKMDFVLGNPPYIRVHNLTDDLNNIKKFNFAQSGMTDLYLVFYEIGIKMLNEHGVLGYITPSSFFNSVAGKTMRRYVTQNNMIDKIVDLKHFQAFSATTYTVIAILKKKRTIKHIEYFEFDEKNKIPYYVDSLTENDFYISDNFFFSTKQNLSELKNMLYFNYQHEYFQVKNGFATLADNFFIGQFEFNNFTIPIVKASTGQKLKCIFPYNDKGQIVNLSEIEKEKDLYEYFSKNKETLTKRSLEKQENWYGFGRTQGIKDVYKEKYSINTLVRDIKDIRLLSSPSGWGVYSGLYIMTAVDEMVLREMLLSDNFINYIKLLSKYKSGGYYTFSSKDLKIYLEYKYAQRINQDEQFTIFRNS